MSSPEPVGWTFLRSKRWLGYWSLLIVFSIVCVFLGNWQFARRAEAQAEIARIDAHYDSSPVELATVLSPDEQFNDDKHKWLPVTVTGTYLTDQVMFVRNRPFETNIGFNLIVPFQREDGSVFVIDRGWVPAGENAERPAALPAPPEGLITVTARLRAGEPVIPGRVSTVDAQGALSLATINLDEIAETVNAPTYTSAYGQLVTEEPSTEHGELASRPERDEGPHLSYALQWFVFILIAIAGTLYGARSEYRSLNIGSKALQLRDARARARRSRRGLTDAESEDAYLDAQQSLRS